MLPGPPLQRVPLGARRADDGDLDRAVQHRLAPRPATSRRTAAPARRASATVASAASAASRCRPEPVSAAYSASACTIADSPDGEALSDGSRGRATSASASSAVSKKPPSGAAKRSSAVSSSRPRALQPDRVAGRLEQVEEAGGDAAVVLEHPGRRADDAVARDPAQPAVDDVDPPEQARRPPGRRGRTAARPSSRPARHSPLIASPFHAATTLSSRAGRSRAVASGPEQPLRPGTSA